MTSADVVLSVAGLAIGVRSTSAASLVEDVSFTVRKKEIVCIVGESGSGKSITSLAVMGLLPEQALRATDGSIKLAGEELRGASPARLRALRATRMAMIFQEPMTALNPVIKLGQQVDEVLKKHTKLRKGERRRKILDIFREVQLPDVERIFNCYPHEC